MWLGDRKVGAVDSVARVTNDPGTLTITCRKCSQDIDLGRVGVDRYRGPGCCPRCGADLLAEAAF